MIKQYDINYRPHSRDKRYYLMITQLRTGTLSSTYSNRYRLPQKKSRVPQVIIGMSIGFAALYLALYFHCFDWLGSLFGMEWAITK